MGIKVISLIFVIAGLLLGLMAVFMAPAEHMVELARIETFFRVMMPVLAAGALIRFLLVGVSKD